MRAGGKRRSYFEEKLQLHPVAFLLGAVCIAAAAVVLSLYTLGTEVSYDGVELGVVSSSRAAAQTVAQLEAITQETLGDADYAVDETLLETTTGVYPRKAMVSKDTLLEELGDEVGLVEYANVLYVSGERWWPPPAPARWRTCWSS